MALSMITESGLISWRCHNGTCQPRLAHILDDDVKWIGMDIIQLPVCPACGEIRSLKIRFTVDEERTDNMMEYGMVPTEMTVPHAMTGEPIPVMIPALKPIGTNPAIERHKEMCRQLEAAGKLYEAPDE